MRRVHHEGMLNRIECITKGCLIEFHMPGIKGVWARVKTSDARLNREALRLAIPKDATLLRSLETKTLRNIKLRFIERRACSEDPGRG